MSIKITQGTTKREWSKLAGALVETSLKALKRARDLAQIATSIMNVAIRDGLPAHESALSWRTAEAQQRNAEESLFGLVDSLFSRWIPNRVVFDQIRRRMAAWTSEDFLNLIKATLSVDS